MFKEMPLEESLLSGFEFPVALVVEVTKQGVVLSKQRYLRAVGDVVNQTIRCASIEMYAHTGQFVDPHLRLGLGGPVGVDLLYNFKVDKHLLNQTVQNIKQDKLRINFNNPQTGEMARALMEKIRNKERINYRRLSSQEQGLILEPYVSYILSRAGRGRRKVFQNVELLNREGIIRCHEGNDIHQYNPIPAPVMEVDVLMITELAALNSILTDLVNYGFIHERPQY